MGVWLAIHLLLLGGDILESQSFSGCGRPTFTARIVGGQGATVGEWPWQISLRYNGKHLCGGSLIASQWVVSAAHCFPSNYYFSNYRVVLGEYEFGSYNPNISSSAVKHVIINSNYSGEGSSGDIALVELTSPVVFTSFILPVCLPSASVWFPNGLRCWATGWGDLQYGKDAPYPLVLQEVQMPIVDAASCDAMYHINSAVSPSYTQVQDNMICAGYPEGGKDSCQGDSGGPLVCQVDGTWLLAGIVSWGEECALPNRPGVYTKVAAYANWIQKHLPAVEFIAAKFAINATVPTVQNTNSTIPGEKSNQNFVTSHQGSLKASVALLLAVFLLSHM